MRRSTSIVSSPTFALDKNRLTYRLYKALAWSFPIWHERNGWCSMGYAVSNHPGRVLPVRAYIYDNAEHLLKAASRYNFAVPDQAGTFWYHSHVSTQYCDGLRCDLFTPIQESLANPYFAVARWSYMVCKDWELAPTICSLVIRSE